MSTPTAFNLEINDHAPVAASLSPPPSQAFDFLQPGSVSGGAPATYLHPPVGGGFTYGGGDAGGPHQQLPSPSPPPPAVGAFDLSMGAGAAPEPQVAAAGPVDNSAGACAAPAAALRDLLRFLLAVARTPTDGDAAATHRAFSGAWSQMPTPRTQQEVGEALKAVFAMPPQHLQWVLGHLQVGERSFVHLRALDLAGTAVPLATDVALASAMVRWLHKTALPALAAFPEDAELGTTAEVFKAFRAVEAMAQMAKPDAVNPAVVRATQAANGAIASAESLKARLVSLGVDPAGDPARDGALAAQAAGTHKPRCSSKNGGVIALGALFGVAVIALIVFIALYVSGKRAQKTTVPAAAPSSSQPLPQPISAAAGTGVPNSGGVTRHSVGLDSWGFPSPV